MSMIRFDLYGNKDARIDSKADIVRMMQDFYEYYGTQEATARAIGCPLRNCTRWLRGQTLPTFAWRLVIKAGHEQLMKKLKKEGYELKRDEQYNDVDVDWTDAKDARKNKGGEE